jgi:hypothetical protein
VQSRAMQDEGPFGPRNDSLQAIVETDLLAEADASWLGGEKGIGAGLDDEIVDAFGGDLAAEAIVLFDERYANAGIAADEGMGGGQSGNATAEHHNVTARRRVI